MDGGVERPAKQPSNPVQPTAAQAKPGAAGAAPNTGGSLETPREIPTDDIPANSDMPVPRDPKAYLDNSWKRSDGPELQPNYVDQASIASRRKISPIGHYQGVSLFGDNPPPIAPQKIGVGPAKLTWTGFEAGPGIGKVFFQLSTMVEPEVWADGKTIEVNLQQTSAIVANNMRYLDTRHFDTPVQRVRLRKRGKHTRVQIKLDEEMIPEVEIMDAPQGYKMLVLEFRRADSQVKKGMTPALLAPTPVAAP